MKNSCLCIFSLCLFFMTDGFLKTGYSQLSVIVQSLFITGHFSSYHVCRKRLRVKIKDKHLFTKLSRHPRKQGCMQQVELDFKSATDLSACYVLSGEFLQWQNGAGCGIKLQRVFFSAGISYQHLVLQIIDHRMSVLQLPFRLSRPVPSVFFFFQRG